MKPSALLVAAAVGALVLSAGALVAPASAQPATTWPEWVWNPRPDPDDVVLPMPCGGAMALRVVETGSAGALDDRRVVLGRNDEIRAVQDFRREAHVDGPFAKGDRSYYLIGKYEVTEAQRDAVSGTCPAQPSPMPATNASWYDAVAFTRAYSTWLLENAADALPSAETGVAFVRLPTEAEWEFATRGGMAVGPEVFRADVFADLVDNVAEIWSPGNQLPLAIGGKDPNPLGLYDVLGNAEEIVLEPFRLNRVGRMHGQVGGFIARGGSTQDQADVISSAKRSEYPFFESHGGIAAESRRETLGYRVVLGAPAMGDFASADGLERSFAALRDAGEAPTAQAQPRPEAELEAIAREQTAGLRNQIAEVVAELRAEETRRREADLRSASAMLFSAATLLNELDETGETVEFFSYESENNPDLSPDLAAEWAERANSNLAHFGRVGSAYVTVLLQLGDEFGQQLPDAFDQLMSDLAMRDQIATFGALVERARRDAVSLGDGTQDTRSVLSGILERSRAEVEANRPGVDSP
ncbi:formylglycine-generating enzyme family protein [Salinarimonas sp. NSM]|uniref:formylglycine-generating enzyme family protein n=1 Tax=Salinarimonas sp. NSM TaxID=3458003 RepID=UPI0040352559